MNTRTTLRGAAVAMTVAALLQASTAAADAIPLPLSSVECRATIAKEYNKLVKTALKTVTGCHKSRNKDALLSGTDCNDLLGGGDLLGPADLKAKFPGAALKFTTAVDEVCGAEEPYLLQPDGVDPLEEDHYVSCPYTCDGVDNGISTMEQAADCLACTAAGIAGEIGALTLGSPTVPLSKEDAKCHGAIGKGYGKYLLAGLKAELACQTADDETNDNDTASCFGDDPKLKVAGALTKAGEGLAACSAAGVVLANVDSCATDTVPNLEICNDAAWASSQDDAFTHAFDMPSNICPNAVRTRIRGGCSTQGSIEGICSSGFQTNTTLAVGWKGLAHGVDITDDYTLAGDLDCGIGTPGMCGDCIIEGISIDNPQYVAFTRCKSNSSKPCTMPFQVDPACLPGTGECRYFLGPPLAISAGGTPTCTLNTMNTDITGTANPDDGSSEFFVDLRSVVYTGLSQQHPCPYCRSEGVCNGGDNTGDMCREEGDCPNGSCDGNDEIPQDGVKGGRCVGGLNTGLTCDVQAFDLSFAPTDAGNPTAGSSLDCPPLPLANISGGGLAIGLQLSTGTVTKDAQDPCEPPLGALDCFCGVCSGDSNYSCQTDLDCSSVGKGVCDSTGGVSRKPNNCTDGFCNVVPGKTDRGECGGGHCVNGPTPGMACLITPDCGLGGTCSLPDADNFCSGLTLANGKGILTCGVDADCDAYITGNPNPDMHVCPGDDCGTCSVSTFRSCFLDPLSLTGIPDTENPTLVGTFCLPPSTNGSVNSSTGSPGPGTVKTEALVEKRY